MADSYGQHRITLAKELKRRIIAKGGAGVTVRGGRGTAWDWIDVCGTNYNTFTPEQRVAVEAVVGRPAGGNVWVGEIETVERILGVKPYFGE